MGGDYSGCWSLPLARETWGCPRRARPAGPLYALRFDFHAVPEGDVVFDLSGLRHWVRIEPRRIPIGLAVDRDRVVTRLTLPVAGGVGVAGLKQLPVDGARREVVIAFDDDRLVTLGQGRPVPYCFHCPSDNRSRT